MSSGECRENVRQRIGEFDVENERISGVVRARTTGSKFSARRAATEDMNLRRSALALRLHSALYPPNPVSSSSASATGARLALTYLPLGGPNDIPRCPDGLERRAGGDACDRALDALVEAARRPSS